MCSALFVVPFTIAGFWTFVQPRPGHAAKPDAKTAAKMVDDLATRNKAPKIIECEYDAASYVPLFPEDYDWSEQDRVHKAVRRVYKDTSVELWEELVRRSRDKRYSLTVKNYKNTDPERWTVGDFCSDLASWRLTGLVLQHLRREDSGGDKESTIYLDVDLGLGNLREWRKQRKNKVLYQLQIELCERALARLPAAKGASQEKKDAARKKIMAELEKLKQTRKPIFVPTNVAGMDLFDAKEAKQIREVLRKRKKLTPDKPSP
jgi:hypothetical protein